MEDTIAGDPLNEVLHSLLPAEGGSGFPWHRNKVRTHYLMLEVLHGPPLLTMPRSSASSTRPPRGLLPQALLLGLEALCGVPPTAGSLAAFEYQRHPFSRRQPIAAHFPYVTQHPAGWL